MSALTPTVERVHVHADRAGMGRAAGADVARAIRETIAAQGFARVMFAAAPSQTETLATLVEEPGIAWDRVDVFHMDEYVGLEPDAPERFAVWLRAHLFDRLPFRSVHVIDPGADPATEAVRYASLLDAAPIDVVVLGIGENGHIAFNDPGVADLADPLTVKVVELDEVCRRQQVEDDCFVRIEDVPATAVTVTVPGLLSGRRLFCVVPGGRKAEAVRATLVEPVSTAWPSTALRGHPDCRIYLDADSASLLDGVRA